MSRLLLSLEGPRRWIPRWLDQIRQDGVYGIRMLRRNPGFAVVAILSLALGIGANTAIFQLIDAVRLQPLPVARAAELADVRIVGRHDNWGVSTGEDAQLTFPLWEAIRRYQTAFSGVFAWGNSPMLVGTGPEMRQVTGLWASGEAFSVLGLTPAVGRLFDRTDDERGCSPVAVISHAFWQGHFGGDPSVVGRTLTIFDHSVRVVGVTRRGFFGLEVGQQFDVAMPVCAMAAWNAIDRPDWFWLSVMGRLQRGWTVGRAAEHLNALSPGIFEATLPSGYESSYLDIYRHFRLTAVPAANGVSRLRTAYGDALWFLLLMTGIVLLIACLNLTNLLLARATAREQEIAVRVALGASRRRVVAQLLLESLMLAVAGAILGGILAHPLSLGLVALLTTESNAPHLNLQFDWRMIAFGTGIAVVTSLVFGLVPALRVSGVDPGAAMKAGGRGTSVSRDRIKMQRYLVAGHLALSVVLLVGAILFGRTFINLMTLDTGLRHDGVLLASFADFSTSPSTGGRSLAQADLLERIRSVPEVESAAATSQLPLNGNHWTLNVVLPSDPSTRHFSQFIYVTSRYFNTVGMRLVIGRDFTDRDTAAAPGVALVNETFVQRYVSGSPVGTTLRTVAEPGLPETAYTIVGVVSDAKYADLREPIPPVVFVPLAQDPVPPLWPGIVIRSSAPTAAAAIRRAVNEARPNMSIGVTVLETAVRDGLLRERLLAWLSGALGSLATLLAIIGVYGVVSYFVACRRREIGIRLALGAGRPRVFRWVFGETFAMLVIGLAVGTALSLAVASAANDLLFGLSPRDPVTILIAGGVLAVVVLLATVLPAVRASGVNPIAALRCD